MDDLPHLVVDEPKRSKKALAAIIVASVMIILIPAGVYLVSQRTQLTPQAATETKSQLPETSLSLTSVSEKAALGGEIAVDIIVRADSDNINLVNTKIKFDPQALKVTRIATSSASKDYFATKWFESSYNNAQGQAALIGGLPNPGMKTIPGQTLKLATIHFQPLRLGPISISFQEDSEVLRNSDNINALQKLNSIDLNISEGLAGLSAKPSEAGKSVPPVKPGGVLTLISPNGGEEYSYFKPINILWNSKDIEKIKSISLYINEELFGDIATNIVNTNQYAWSPESTLLLPYITVSNTYQVEVTGTNKKGEEIKVKSDGPFGILTKENIVSLIPDASLDGLNLNITDASLLLSQFNKELNQSKVDLNKDGAVNQIDLWLLRKSLLQKGLIKAS